MSLAIETYLDRVMAYANRTGEEALAIREELQDHLLEKIERLRQRMAMEDAVFTAIEESGQPLVVGYRLRPAFPLIDVRIRGTARGVIAIGPRAVGVFAFGGIAIGVFAVGAVSLGMVGIGLVTAAMFFGWAGAAVVPFGVASAGLALGLVSIGVVAVGVVAGGWYATGLWAAGVNAASFFPYETVPEWIRWIGPYVMSVPEQAYLAFFIVAVVLPVAIVGGRAIHREQLRLERIDPSLQGG